MEVAFYGRSKAIYIGAMLTFRTDGVEILKFLPIREFQNPHIRGDIEPKATVPASDPLSIVVKQYDNIVLDFYTYKSLHKPRQITRTREWVSVFHINELEKVSDMRAQQSECVFEYCRIRTSFCHNEEFFAPIKLADKFIPSGPSSDIQVIEGPSDG